MLFCVMDSVVCPIIDDISCRKNGFAVYNPLAQNKWREVCMPWEGRFLSSISKKSYYCVKKTGALF